jgi:hypothetical protein
VQPGSQKIVPHNPPQLRVGFTGMPMGKIVAWTTTQERRADIKIGRNLCIGEMRDVKLANWKTSRGRSMASMPFKRGCIYIRIRADNKH